MSDDLIKKARKEYLRGSLDEAGLSSDPLKIFEQWFKEACGAVLIEPNAMTLSTVGSDGRPSSRVVLLKHYDREGFVFFTNYDSRKGGEMAANAQVALLFYWDALERQIRIEGVAKRVEKEISEQYFSQRPRGSQLAALASQQSRVVESRAELEARVEKLAQEFEGRAVQCPECWGGYCVTPEQFEFWQGRENKLHDRIRFSWDGAGWLRERLAP